MGLGLWNPFQDQICNLPIRSIDEEPGARLAISSGASGLPTPLLPWQVKQVPESLKSVEPSVTKAALAGGQPAPPVGGAAAIAPPSPAPAISAPAKTSARLVGIVHLDAIG